MRYCRFVINTNVYEPYPLDHNLGLDVWVSRASVTKYVSQRAARAVHVGMPEGKGQRTGLSSWKGKLTTEEKLFLHFDKTSAQAHTRTASFFVLCEICKLIQFEPTVINLLTDCHTVANILTFHSNRNTDKSRKYKDSHSYEWWERWFHWANPYAIWRRKQPHVFIPRTLNPFISIMTAGDIVEIY